MIGFLTVVPRQLPSVHPVFAEGRKVVRTADEAIERRLKALAKNLAEHERHQAFKGLRFWGKALDAARAKVVKAV